MSLKFPELRKQLLQMTIAGFESVYWRQDKFKTGGIIESDERVDEGRLLYGHWCWPRTYIVEPLLIVRQFDRVRRFLDFWLRCQRPDGSWLHCYDIRDYKEFPGYSETDNVGYMLWHISQYIDASDDGNWLSVNWASVKKAGRFLEKKYNSEKKMIWGEEESEISTKRKVRYSLHMNCVCALGFGSAANLAKMVGEEETASRWRNISEEILSRGILSLWDEEERSFAFGLTEEGSRVTSPALWMTLMPFWLFDQFDDKLTDTLSYLKRKLYDKDPIIPKTYWFYDYSPFINSGKPIENKYSGSGVTIGGLPVLIDALLKAEKNTHAEEQLNKIIDFTNPDSKLIPEHINTLDPGKIGNYSVYPSSYYYVDSGNLLHLSFFMTLISRHDPEMLKHASKNAESMLAGSSYDKS